MAYNCKVYKSNGGDVLEASNGGIIIVENGAELQFGDAGSVVFYIGADSGATEEFLCVSGLPTSDPGVTGALYVSNGFLKIST